MNKQHIDIISIDHYQNYTLLNTVILKGMVRIGDYIVLGGEPRKIENIRLYGQDTALAYKDENVILVLPDVFEITETTAVIIAKESAALKTYKKLEERISPEKAKKLVKKMVYDKDMDDLSSAGLTVISEALPSEYTAIIFKYAGSKHQDMLKKCLKSKDPLDKCMLQSIDQILIQIEDEVKCDKTKDKQKCKKAKDSVINYFKSLKKSLGNI